MLCAKSHKVGVACFGQRTTMITCDGGHTAQLFLTPAQRWFQFANHAMAALEMSSSTFAASHIMSDPRNLKDTAILRFAGNHAMLRQRVVELQRNPRDVR